MLADSVCVGASGNDARRSFPCRPGGPFVLQQKNFAFLGYGASDGIPAYFSRAYLGPDGAVLANYQQTGSHGAFLAPLK